MILFSRETYKYYSAIAPAGQIFSISMNVFSDIVSNCEGLVDGNHLKLADLDFEFIATNAGISKTKHNPERQLVRHEFIEIFVRIAITKLFKTKQIESIPESVEHLYKTYLEEIFQTFDCHKWRREKLWNEECDVTLKRNMPTIEKIYKAYSGRFALPGAPQ